MSSKTTYERLINYNAHSRVWLNEDKGNAKTKLGYAISRLSPRIEKLLQRYQNESEDINIDHCATDDKGYILRDERGDYRFTRDELKKRNHARQKLFESEVEIEPYFATEVPDDLPAAFHEICLGLIIREETESATS